VNTFDLVKPQTTNFIGPSREDGFLFFHCSGLLQPLPALDKVRVVFRVNCKLWRAGENGQCVIRTLCLKSFQFLNSSRDRFDGLAVFGHEGDPSGCLFAADWILNSQPRIKLPVPNAQPANRLLAPVEDFCESTVMRLTLVALTGCAKSRAFGVPYGVMSFHALTVSQKVATASISIRNTVVSYYK
jgi:hypothetical protein